MKSTYPLSTLLNVQKLRTLLSFGIKGYLAEIGWFESNKSKTSVNTNRQPIPWFTYSFIDFLDVRLTTNQSIFEYGSGNSTRYFAKKVKDITSLEHDRLWYEQGIKNKPENAEIVFCELDENGKYCRGAKNSKQKFNIIIVDGRDRVNCCLQSMDSLSEDGVLILDDSERAQYDVGRKALINNGFKEISFSGISPGLFYRKETSVFYRSNNCLGI